MEQLLAAVVDEYSRQRNIRVVADASEEWTTAKVEMIFKKSVVRARSREKFKKSTFCFPLLLVGEVAGAHLFIVFCDIRIGFQIIANPIAAF